MKETNKPSSGRKTRRASTPEAREDQLIALAIDVAEEQLINRTASAQVITHFLKLGSTKERLEKEKLEEETKLVSAKRKAIESEERSEALYAEALKAMRHYRGEKDDDEYEA